MTVCTLFDPATGEITQIADLSDETFAHYVETGTSALLDVRGDPDTQYVGKDANDAWALVDYTAEELAAKRGMLPGQKWLMPDRVVVTDSAVPVASLQAMMWERIKVKRDSIKSGGALVDGRWFHSDDPSRIQQLGLVMMGANVPAIQWKTMSGAFVTMSQTLAGAIFNAVASLDQSAFANAEQHRAAMEASANPAAYDFSTGWPQVYADTLQS